MGLIGGVKEHTSVKLYILLLLICLIVLLIFSSFVSLDEKGTVMTIRIALWAAVGIIGIFTLLGYLSDWE